MTYIEYSTSAGHGTLVEHKASKEVDDLEVVDFQSINGNLHTRQIITPERYSEFISIHGGEKAV